MCIISRDKLEDVFLRLGIGKNAHDIDFDQVSSLSWIKVGDGWCWTRKGGGIKQIPYIENGIIPNKFQVSMATNVSGSVTFLT